MKLNIFLWLLVIVGMVIVAIIFFMKFLDLKDTPALRQDEIADNDGTWPSVHLCFDTDVWAISAPDTFLTVSFKSYTDNVPVQTLQTTFQTQLLEENYSPSVDGPMTVSCFSPPSDAFSGPGRLSFDFTYSFIMSTTEVATLQDDPVYLAFGDDITTIESAEWEALSTMILYNVEWSKVDLRNELKPWESRMKYPKEPEAVALAPYSVSYVDTHYEYEYKASFTVTYLKDPKILVEKIVSAYSFMDMISSIGGIFNIFKLVQGIILLLALKTIFRKYSRRELLEERAEELVEMGMKVPGPSSPSVTSVPVAVQMTPSPLHHPNNAWPVHPTIELKYIEIWPPPPAPTTFFLNFFYIYIRLYYSQNDWYGSFLTHSFYSCLCLLSLSFKFFFVLYHDKKLKFH